MIAEDFDACWELDPETGCHVWMRGRSKQGYGRRSYQGKQTGAHRVAWMLANGPVPEGLQLDHLCRNRACVNPEHLEPVTCRENVMRSPICPSAVNARKTHCDEGHPLYGPNLYLQRNGGRRCRTCWRTRRRVRLGPVTETRQRALRILRDHAPIRAREFAVLLWPDNPAHENPSKRGSDEMGIGAGMSLAGGSYLSRLRRDGLVEWRSFKSKRRDHALTPAGEEALAAAEERQNA